MSNLGLSNQQIIKKIDKRVNERIQDECLVVYSAYDYDEWDKPIDNLDEVPVKGRVKFVSEDNEFESVIFESPNWLEIAVIANNMLKLTRDYQNRYLKDIEVIRNNGDYLIAIFIMENI